LLYWTGNAPRGSIALLIGLLAAQGFFLNGVQVTLWSPTCIVRGAGHRRVGIALAVGRVGGILCAFAGVMAVVAVGLFLIRRHIPASSGSSVSGGCAK
jgi:hypothetical protein